MNRIKNRFLVYFASIVLFFEGIYWVITLFTRSLFLDTYYSNDFNDSFMDYYNMLALLSDGDPYKYLANYPPFVFLILKGFYHLIPLDYASAGGKNLRVIEPAIIGFCLIVVFSVTFFYTIISYYFNKNSIKNNTLLIWSLLFSGPFTFALERGNVIIISFLFLLVFLALYDDGVKRNRIIAYIALALAASIKIYPAIFGLMILFKKRYKESLYAISFGIVFFFAPFFLFNGVNDMRRMIEGILVSGAESDHLGCGFCFSLTNLINMTTNFLGFDVRIPSVLVVLIVFFLATFLLYASRNDWEKLFILGLVCIWLPRFSYTYTLLFFFPAIIFYIIEVELQQEKRQCIVDICFVLILLPLALPLVEQSMEYKFPLSYPTLVINIAIIVLVIKMLKTSVFRVLIQRNM